MLKIQVIDLVEHLIGIWRAQIKSVLYRTARVRGERRGARLQAVALGWRETGARAA